jgi:hypothetical protein
MTMGGASGIVGLLSAPGCYAYQVDGEGFTAVIVVEVAAENS